MQPNDLQNAWAYLQTLFITYETQGVQITGSRMPITQYANFAAMKYLLFLANQDRIITDAETEFINICLNQNATTQAMERFLKQYPVSFSGAADSLLAMLAALVRMDLQTDDAEGSVSLLWLETIKQMGTQFSQNPAARIEPQQQIVQNSMIRQLTDYRNAAMRGNRRPELENALHIPANFKLDLPPVPPEKEASVSEEKVTEAPTETLDELLASISGTAKCERRVGAPDPLIENSFYSTGTWSPFAANFTAYGIFGKSRHRKNNSCTAFSKDIRSAKRFEKRTSSRSRSCSIGQRLCGANGDQDEKSGGKINGRCAFH